MESGVSVRGSAVGGTGSAKAGALEGLEEDASGTGEAGHEEAFAGEEDAADAAGHLDVVVDGLGEGGEVAGADDERFAGGEVTFDEVAGAMDEDEAGAGDLLEEESGPAEEGGTGAAGNGDIDMDLGAEGGEEGASGGEDASIGEVPGDDLAGGVGAEGDALAGAVAFDVGEGEAFAGEHAADGSGEAAGDLEAPADIGVKGHEGALAAPAGVAGFEGEDGGLGEGAFDGVVHG